MALARHRLSPPRTQLAQDHAAAALAARYRTGSPTSAGHRFTPSVLSALSRNSGGMPIHSSSVMERFPVHSEVASATTTGPNSGMAGLPGLPARDRRAEQDAEAVGAAQARATGSWCVPAAGGSCAEFTSAASGRCGTCRGASSRPRWYIELYRVKCPECGVKMREGAAIAE